MDQELLLAMAKQTEALQVVAQALMAIADGMQAQAISINALADAIAAPIEEEPKVDNRPRYMDGTLIEDG